MTIRHIQPAVAVAFSLAVGACAAVTGADGVRMRPGTDAFAEYVESVFRLQNETLSALAFALDGEEFGTSRYQALEDAEAWLLDSCEGLNALASARQRGERAGGPGALKTARRAPECERAAQSAEDLLGEAP